MMSLSCLLPLVILFLLLLLPQQSRTLQQLLLLLMMLREQRSSYGLHGRACVESVRGERAWRACVDVGATEDEGARLSRHYLIALGT